MRESLKTQILSILAEGEDMTVATLCEDGGPQATAVSYASEGLRIYFGCAPDSCKAQNLGRDPRAAIVVTLPYKDWSQIRGLTVTATARAIEDAAEVARIGELFFRKFPEISQYVSDPTQPLRLFELTPSVISVLDYSQGFGHTERTELATSDLAA